MLNLASNSITEEGGEHLVTAMTQNATLLQLNIDFNLLTLSQIKTLSGFISKNVKHHKRTLFMPKTKVDTLKTVRTEIK